MVETPVTLASLPSQIIRAHQGEISATSPPHKTAFLLHYLSIINNDLLN